MSATIDMLRAALRERPDEPATVIGARDALVAYAAAELSADEFVVLVAPDEHRAGQLELDLAALTDTEVIRLPALDSPPYADLQPDKSRTFDRLAGLARLASAPERAIVLLSVASLERKVIPRTQLLALCARVEVGDTVDRDEFARTLDAAGYYRVKVVDDPGTFAVRGEIVDLFPPMSRYPVRVELFGDTVEALRSFDPSSQRTQGVLDHVIVHPARETIATAGVDVRERILQAADASAHPSRETRRILEAIGEGEHFVGLDTLVPAFHAALAPATEYIPDGARWLWSDPLECEQAAEPDELRLAHYQRRLDEHRLAFPPDEFFLSNIEMTALREQHRRRVDLLAWHPPDKDARAIEFDSERMGKLRDRLREKRLRDVTELLEPLASELAELRRQDYRAVIMCSSESSEQRVAGLLGQYDVEFVRSGGGEDIDHERQFPPTEARPGGLPVLHRGRLSHGFSLAGDRLIVISDVDVFGEKRAIAPPSRRQRKRAAKDALFGGVSNFAQLSPGDLLVHDLHGVGRYLGLEKLPLGSGDGAAQIDFLQLEYVGGQLYLPVFRIGEVQRYIGAEGHKPRIDKLGGTTWQNQRKKVGIKVRALAEQLLLLYAQRAALPGRAFPKRDAMFTEFEATFPYEETPDQQSAIDEVVADMESMRVMDRLVCGDVGYGKTEIALRAALKAVIGGTQVAMLAPTTVLVEQHYATMVKRFAGWPVQVERLSRFQSKREQLDVITRLADGRIDLVVGTHRLLSKDVRFSRLGLVVIDEEQRFGVTHKERLKKMRTQVDVLTLTATPIPRTLHLAMSGLRDLSIIATPPADRRSIRTFVARPSDKLLRDALRTELSRQGQVYFVVPRIDGKPGTYQRSLGEWADYLAELLPSAKVVVAHGQMKPSALSGAMVSFVGGECNVLVSTSIVESGLDIPTANTMIIADAHKFGLAQLYQLRGRIGRSSERAYCYLLAPESGKLTDDAKKRLDTLQRFTELGAGFAIASRDLEIRGAGELLGARQSGSIAAVGFDAYTQMLEEAVAELRGEPIERAADPELSTDLPGYIPDDYVPETGQRLDLYKRLSQVAGPAAGDDMTALLEEIGDRFGAPPIEVLLLADLMVAKAHARALCAIAIDVTATQVALTFGPDGRSPLSQEPGSARLLELLNQRDSPYRMTPDQRLLCRLPAGKGQSTTSQARRRLLELLACVT